ncbi:hypothetical protein ACFLQJ_02860 [Calditrichota bacterium]
MKNYHHFFRLFHSLAPIILVLVFSTSGLRAAEPSFRIIHNPVTSALVGTEIKITASIEGNLAPEEIEEAMLYFRVSGDPDYERIEMNLDMEEFQVILPAEIVDGRTVEYYIRMTQSGRNYNTFPTLSPKLNPISISVRELKKKIRRPVQSPLVIISPEPDSEQEETEAQLVVSINRSIRKLNPTKIGLLLDKKNITNLAVITEDIIIASIPNLQLGKHSIEVIYLGKGGKKILVDSWSFKIISKIEESIIARSTVRGNAGVNAIYRDVNGRISRLAFEDFNIRAEIDKWRLVAFGKLSSEEHRTIQPQHRYRIEVGTQKYILKVGDVNPRYNKLALWGRRIRGVAVDLQPGKFRIQSVYGDLRRPVDSETGRIDTMFVNDDTTQGVDHIDTTFASGTYRRWAGAMHLSYNPSRNFTIGYLMMKAKDDVESVRSGSKPKDNLVYGLDLNAFADMRRINFNSSMVVSLFTDDISIDPIEGSEPIKDIIWINQTFDPLPNDTSATLSNFYGSIFQKTFSTDSRMRLRYFDNDLSFGFRRVSKSFHTLSNPTMSRDRQGLFVQDRIRLLSSSLYLDLGYSRYNNNIFKVNDYTDYYNQFSFGFSVYTADAYPDLSLSYRNRLNTNDADAFYIIDGDINDPDSTLIDDRKQDQTNLVTLSSVYSFPFIMTSNNVNASLMLSDRADEYSATGSAKQRGFNINLNTNIEDSPVYTNLGYSMMEQNTGEGFSQIIYHTITARLNINLFNRKLNPYFGPRLTFGNGENGLSPYSPTEILLMSNPDLDLNNPLVATTIDTLNKKTPKSLVIDFIRVDWSGGVMYEFIPNHILRTAVSYSRPRDKNKLEYFNGARFNPTVETVWNDGINVDQSTGGAVTGSNIIASIGYQYRF